MGRVERGSSNHRIQWIVLIYGILFIIWIWAVVGPAALVPNGGVEAQRLHAGLDELADGSLRAVAHASVQLLTLGDFTHVGDHIPAGVRADRAAEKFPAVFQIVLHSRAALLVSLALAPGFRAAGAGSPGQTGLDGPLGARAHRVVGAAAVLQSRPAFGQIELDEGRDAVAGALLLLAVQHGAAGARVVFVRVMALGLGLAVHDGLPAYQPPTVGRRGHGQVGKKQEHEAERPEGSADAPCQCARACHCSGCERR